MIEFSIPLHINAKWGLNQKYAGQHWSARNREAHDIHMLVNASLRAAKIPKKLFVRPVRITIYYDTRLDIDNHGYISKLIIDGLKGYLIKDDSRRYVRALYQEFVDGMRDKVTVRLEEINV